MRTLDNDQVRNILASILNNDSDVMQMSPIIVTPREYRDRCIRSQTMGVTSKNNEWQVGDAET